MDNNPIEFNYKKRHNLSKSDKLFNYASSFIFFSIGIFGILKGFPNKFLFIAYLFIALIPLIRNFLGKESFLTRHSLKADNNRITIIISRNSQVIIPLKSVVQVSILTSGLKFSFSDSVKFIDLSWLDSSQFQILKDKLLSLSKLHSFKIY